MPHAPGKVTQILQHLETGNQEALDELISVVYDELHRLARHYMRHERAGHTLQASALVNEAYLRLVEQQDRNWHNRAHFIGVTARLMRQILVNYANRRLASRRRGDRAVPLQDDDHLPSMQESEEIFALDEALTQLQAIDPRQGAIVEMRFFGGLTVEETAEALGVSPGTIKREWRLAKAWLHRRIRQGFADVPERMGSD